jgi:hypothetical protein
MFTRPNPALSRLSSLTVALALVGGGFGALQVTSHPARAQAPTNAAQPAKEVQDLLMDLDDIDTLRVLLPMKFTPEQIEKLIPVINNARTDYDTKSAALTSVPLLKMAAEIRETRKKAIAGTPVPTPFDDRIKGIQADVAAKRKALDAANILALSDACRKILTADQYALCIKMEIDAYKRNKRYNDKASEGQYFNAYVLDVFLGNPRTVPLLKELKATPIGK